MNDVSILLEHPDYIAIAKPAGVVVHRDAHHQSDVITDWALAQYPEISGVGDDSSRPGIVHRLDKDTSGALLIARTQAGFDHLKKLFQTGKVAKTYIALAVGVVKDDAGVINEPIARSTKHFQKRVVGGQQGRSREAITEYTVREYLGGYTLLEVRPRTGRTHQIRSHLAHVGHPIACDALYGGKRYACPAGLGRQFLHASSLRFTDRDGNEVSVTAPMPADLEHALRELRK